MTTRVYVPVTAVDLGPLIDRGELAATSSGRTGFAVTPGLRAWYSEDSPPGGAEPDDEDLEYAAAAEAGRGCLRLLAGDPTARSRRIVVAADVDTDRVTVRDDLYRGVVRLAGSLLVTSVAAVFVDDVDAEPTVRRAADMVDAADLGDPEAQEAVDDAEGWELSWYAPSELPTLRAELSG